MTGFFCFFFRLDLPEATLIGNGPLKTAFLGRLLIRPKLAVTLPPSRKATLYVANIFEWPPHPNLEREAHTISARMHHPWMINGRRVHLKN